MCIVVITCPRTGEDISTGIEIEQESFERLPDVLVRSTCPRCGMRHAWWTREAKLTDTPVNATRQIERVAG
jgi:hypothetical protein